MVSTEMLNMFGSVIVTELLAEQPLLSVTVAE
jgi:hypothetical protein